MTRRTRRIAVALAVAVMPLAAAAQQVGQKVVVTGPVAQDLYLAGGSVEVRGDVTGDVIAAGGSIIIDQRVVGDVLAVGGSIVIAAAVLDDVRAAGGSVSVTNRVDGDLILAGGSLELGPEAVVGGRAWLGGGELTVAGRITTKLKAAAERLVITGTIEGDVDVTAERIDIGPTARIAGTLTYRSQHEARIDPAAEIGGGITRVPMPQPSLAGRVLTKIIYAAALGVLGGALILVFPTFATATVRTLQQEPWAALGVGVVALVGIPIAFILMMITVVGFLLGVTVLAAYGFVLVFGFLAGALSLGDLAYRAVAAGAGPDRPTGAWIAALLIGLAVVALVRLVPILGALMSFAVLVFGLGALLIAAHRAWRAARGTAPAPA
jgi:cytoskeletal protein CcmA (bactofilin family)